jgi:hypothetical protein
MSLNKHTCSAQVGYDPRDENSRFGRRAHAMGEVTRSFLVYEATLEPWIPVFLMQIFSLHTTLVGGSVTSVSFTPFCTSASPVFSAYCTDLFMIMSSVFDLG